MTKAELKAALKGAATGTAVSTVIFDYNTELNARTEKNYPLVLWDMVGMRGVKNLRTGEETITLNVYCLILANVVTDQGDDLIADWDEAIGALEEYLTAVNNLSTVSLENMNEVEEELFPAGLLSIEREASVRYRITLKTYC